MSREKKKHLTDNREKKLRNLVPFKPGQSLGHKFGFWKSESALGSDGLIRAAINMTRPHRDLQ
jgi:hypothetical protein